MGQKRGITSNQKSVILTMFLFRTRIIRKRGCLDGAWLKRFPVLLNNKTMTGLGSRLLIMKIPSDMGHKGFEIWALTQKGRKCAKEWLNEIPKLSLAGYATNALVEAYHKEYGFSTQETEVTSR